jgi:hypothetical protein
MSDDKHNIERGIARSLQEEPPIDAGRIAMITFLRAQIVDAEWKIVRAKSEIEAYEVAIEALSKGRSHKAQQP